MKIQIIGPVCGTGYGVVTANLLWALAEELGRDSVTLRSIGRLDSSWFPDKVQEAVLFADQLHRNVPVTPDVTLAIWHEWDHPVSTPELTPGKFAEKYVAMPTFELDRIKPEAQHALRKCWRVLVSSEHCEDVLLKAGLTNVGMAYFHGVHTDIFKHMPKTQLIGNPTFRMINVGKMEYRKGHDLCIDALAHLLKQGREAELWAMWNNPFLMQQSQSQLMVGWIAVAARKFQVNMTRLWDAVRMVGPYPNSQNVAARINLCDLAIYPFRAEGWNLPLLEALACGKPTIASYNTGPKVYLDQSNAWLVGGIEVAANDGHWFGPGKLVGRWIEPSKTQLLKHVDEAYDLWERKPGHVNEDGIKTGEMYTWEKAAKRVISWLDTECGSSS